jgi:hypothetical protein
MALGVAQRLVFRPLRIHSRLAVVSHVFGFASVCTASFLASRAFDITLDHYEHWRGCLIELANQHNDHRSNNSHIDSAYYKKLFNGTFDFGAIFNEISTRTQRALESASSLFKSAFDFPFPCSYYYFGLRCFIITVLISKNNSNNFENCSF